MLIFLLRECEKLLQCKRFSHFFNKNISVFSNKVVKYLTSWPLNELVKLMMLWTTGPRFAVLCIIFKRRFWKKIILHGLNFHNLSLKKLFIEILLSNTTLILSPWCKFLETYGPSFLFWMLFLLLKELFKIFLLLIFTNVGSKGFNPWFKTLKECLR